VPTEGRTRSLRLASVPLLAGLASTSVCLCILVGRARADPLIAAAGDIACDTSSEFFNGGVGTAGHCRQRNTSDLLVQAAPTAVLTLGDNQYHVGSLSDFNASFDPSWGRLKPIIHPTVGNHEYATGGASGYDDYFNGAGNQSGPAGDRDKGYYSFDIGSWHLIALNSECERIDRGAAANGCAAGSPQESSLRADLATHRSSCTLAYWHSPRFNSGFRGDHPETQAFWEALHQAGADVVLNGDAHHYERFALQDPSGNPDPAGIREFIVGTGGAFFTNWSSVKPNSEVRQNTTFGVLALTIHPTSYEWRFLPEPARRSLTQAAVFATVDHPGSLSQGLRRRGSSGLGAPSGEPEATTGWSGQRRRTSSAAWAATTRFERAEATTLFEAAPAGIASTAAADAIASTAAPART
jgi:hypothetical protein